MVLAWPPLAKLKAGETVIFSTANGIGTTYWELYTGAYDDDYRSLYSTQLSAPMVVIAEAAEEEAAVMERVVLCTVVRGLAPFTS